MVGSKLGLASIPEKETQVRVTQQTDRTQERSPREVYSITYAMPGQVGFCVPRIARDQRYLEHLLKLLKAEALITNVQVNSTAASVVVTYKSGEMSDSEMRSHLIDLIQSEVKEPATIQPVNSYPKTQKQTELGMAKETYSITYAMPGQVGFCVPRISTDEKYQERLVKLLKAEALVTKVQINITAGSIVVMYKSGVMSDYEMRSHLANLIQSGITEPAATQPINSYPTVSQIENRQQQDEEKSSVLPAPSPTPVSRHFNVTAVKKIAVATITEHKFLLSRKLPQEGKNKQKCSEIQNSENQSSCLSTQAKVLPISSSRPKSAVLPQKTEQQAKPSAKVAYSIAHVIPGRIRFHVPRIAKDPKYVQRLEALLKADPTVIGERINRAAASVVITYKSAVKANSKDCDSSVLETAISHLANLLQSASDVAVA
ncbi:hypothetical protein [Fischerella thermalis]|uniref:Uncharacterized protein n=1 Tax=Fischerella thermalis CCMEE 5318 TaxID=2019666 RepID=A0A2N6LI94_9CYAN|nr:hypothetical protein [Fischerella thermalis]PMB23964.1 hypothetical protein CEN46_09115 [Fischerella thermalis CCMEE 5318]